MHSWRTDFFSFVKKITYIVQISFFLDKVRPKFLPHMALIWFWEKFNRNQARSPSINSQSVTHQNPPPPLPLSYLHLALSLLVAMAILLHPHPFSLFILLSLFSLLLNPSSCFHPKLLNFSKLQSDTDWSPAGATWYGPANGAGSDGNAWYIK